MKAGDLVLHEFYGLGVVIEQTTPHVDRWFVRWFKNIGRTDNICAAWGYLLEVLNENR